MDSITTRLDGRYLLPNSSSTALISTEHRGSVQSPNKIPDIELRSPSAFLSKVNVQSGSVISKIEDILELMLDCIIDEKKELVLYFKSRKTSRNGVLDAESGAIKTSGSMEARILKFPGKTAQEAWKFSALLRILELSHTALVNGVVITKRDIYYQDPKLFLRQSVVDGFTDDIAFNLGINREALNVVAAAKGLVAGHLSIVKVDKTVVDCRICRQGVLIPSVEEIDRIDMQGARWALVIEKEATFRSLAASRFWETSLAGKGILVTGKGYPDIQTRGFVRLLSTGKRLLQGLGSLYIRTFALMDYDPDGIAIMSTYKHGSISLAHENITLIAPRIEWLGIKSNVIRDLHQENVQMWVKLSSRDRKMAAKLLEKPVCQEEVEASWRWELQVMLMLNIKAEIQILGDVSSLEYYLSSELQSHMSPA